MSTLYTNTITPASGSSVTVTSELTASQGVSVPDDQKLRFGTDADASIEYNEDGDNNLVISGSTTGLVLSGSKLTLDTTTVASGSIAGAGSYLGVTSAGQVVLTSSSGASTTPGGSDTQIQYNNSGSFGGVASLTYNDSTGHITIIDDKKLLFGTGGDASVEYDEDNTNKLIVSGAVGGFDIDLPDNVASAFEISEEANPYVTITTTNSSERIKLSQDVIVIDDKKLWFGTGEDASIEYNEDGDNFLTISGSVTGLALSGGIINIESDTVVKDDKKLYFGTGKDGYVEYNEDGDNFLTISGSAAGLALSGTMVSFDPLTVASGSIAGLGSYLGITSAGKIVLTSSGLPMGGSDGQLQYNNAGDHGGITSFTYNDSTGDLTIIDDKKLYFGTNTDGYIEYNEDGDNFLTISGSATGLALSGTKVSFDPLTVGSGSVAGLGSYLGITSTGQIVLTSSTTAAVGSDTQLQYNNSGSFGGVASLTYNDSTGHLTVIDDKKLYFGTNNDAYIEYDEDGTDELILSGAQGGIDIQVPIPVTDALTISSNGTAYMTFDTSDEAINVHQTLLVADDTKIEFGAGTDASIEYDEDGTDELRFAGAAATFEQDVSFDNNVTLGVAATDITTVTGRLTASQGMLVADDQKLYFGNNNDAYIEYDENGDDVLVIGGTAIEFKLPDDDDAALVVKEGSTAYMTFDTTDGDEIIQSNKEHEFVSGAIVQDDQKLYFGDDNDAYISYDEAGTDELILSGAQGGIDIQAPDGVADGLTISAGGAAYITLDTTSDEQVVTANKEFVFAAGGIVEDDQQLIFGTDDDASIEYNENGDDYLVISGSAAGIAMTGSSIVLDGNTKVKNDYHTVTFESQLSDGDMGSGDILYYEPGGDSALTKGGIYYLHTDGTWNAADADAASTGKQLLGIALGTSARTHGVLIRGFVKIPSTEVLNVPGSGASDGLPVYLSTTAAHIDFTAPSASGDIVRVIGYCIDDDSSDILLLFRPDNTWVEIA